MGYKLKTHSGAAKRFKKTGTTIKSRGANRNHILTKQSTKRKRHNRGLNKLTGTVLKSVSARAKHQKVLNATKGHYGARSRLYKTAKQSNIKSLQYAFRDRKNKKRAFRSLWIARINAACSREGLSYSNFINLLDTNDILLNRKILSDIAISDNATFKKIISTVST